MVKVFFSFLGGGYAILAEPTALRVVAFEKEQLLPTHLASAFLSARRRQQLVRHSPLLGYHPQVSHDGFYQLQAFQPARRF